MKIAYWSGALVMRMVRAACLALLILVVLTACAETDSADPKGLQVWMQNERDKHVPQEPHTPAVDRVQVQKAHQTPYDKHRQGVEPFSAQRLLLTVPADTVQPVTTQLLPVAPGQSRPLLETLPLSGVRLVGSVQRGGETLAMLRVQGWIYSVRVGDKIGQDQGRVSAITISSLFVREVALTALGQPSERVISLALLQEP